MSNKKPTPSTFKPQQNISTKVEASSSVKIFTEVKQEDSLLHIQEYKPSVNSDKYPEPEKPKNQYKILASRNDYIKLQEEVVNHLNNGWELVGGVSNSTSVGQYESITIFVQAVRK